LGGPDCDANCINPDFDISSLLFFNGYFHIPSF
jgi:hypothetical protein